MDISRSHVMNVDLVKVGKLNETLSSSLNTKEDDCSPHSLELHTPRTRRDTSSSSYSDIECSSSNDSNRDETGSSFSDDTDERDSDTNCDKDDCCPTPKGRQLRFLEYDNRSYVSDNAINCPVYLHNKFGRKGIGNGEILDATGLAHVSGGRILLTDMINNRIYLYDKFGKLCRAIYTDENKQPWNTAITPNGHMATTFTSSGMVCVYSGHGSVIRQFGKGRMKTPCGIAIDKSGRYIITDIGKHTVSVYDRQGRFLRDFPEGPEPLKSPRYVTVSSNGNIIVSDTGNHNVKIYNCDGNYMSQFGSFGSAVGSFKSPYGVCCDSLNNIYVADHYNCRISLFDCDGNFICQPLNLEKGLMRPQGVCLTSDSKLCITHGKLKAQEVVLYNTQCQLSKRGTEVDLGYV